MVRRGSEEASGGQAAAERSDLIVVQGDQGAADAAVVDHAEQLEGCLGGGGSVVGDAHDGVWWGGFNRPISEQRYDALRQRMIDHLSSRTLYVRDCHVGADPRWRRRVRAYTETAWASIFCSNLFRIPPASKLDGFAPDFTIVDAPSFRADAGTRTST